MIARPTAIPKRVHAVIFLFAALFAFFQRVSCQETYGIPRDVIEGADLFPSGPSRGFTPETVRLLTRTQNWTNDIPDDEDHKSVIWTGDVSGEGSRYDDESNPAGWPKFKGERGDTHIGIMFADRAQRYPILGFGRIGFRSGEMRTNALTRDHTARFASAGFDVEGNYDLAWTLGGYDAAIAATFLEEAKAAPISVDGGLAMSGYYGGLAVDAEYEFYTSTFGARVLSKETREDETCVFITGATGPWLGIRRDFGKIRVGANAIYAVGSRSYKMEHARRRHTDYYQEITTQPYVTFLDDWFEATVSVARVDTLENLNSEELDKEYYSAGARMNFRFSPRLQFWLEYNAIVGFDDFRGHLFTASIGLAF